MKKSAKKFGGPLLSSPEFCLHCLTAEGAAWCFLADQKTDDRRIVQELDS